MRLYLGLQLKLPFGGGGVQEDAKRISSVLSLKIKRNSDDVITGLSCGQRI